MNHWPFIQQLSSVEVLLERFHLFNREAYRSYARRSAAATAARRTQRKVHLDGVVIRAVGIGVSHHEIVTVRRECGQGQVDVAGLAVGAGASRDVIGGGAGCVAKVLEDIGAQLLQSLVVDHRREAGNRVAVQFDGNLHRCLGGSKRRAGRLGVGEKSGNCRRADDDSCRSGSRRLNRRAELGNAGTIKPGHRVEDAIIVETGHRALGLVYVPVRIPTALGKGCGYQGCQKATSNDSWQGSHADTSLGIVDEWRNVQRHNAPHVAFPRDYRRRCPATILLLSA